MIHGASLFVRLTPEKELNKIKREIAALDNKIIKIAEEKLFYFNKFEIPYIDYQKNEKDPFLRELYMLRAEFDYKYQIVNGLCETLYGESFQCPGLLSALKNNKNVLLFDLNKNFSKEQINKAKINAEFIKRLWKENHDKD